MTSEKLKQAWKDLKSVLILPLLLVVGICAGAILGRGNPAVSTDVFIWWGGCFAILFLALTWSVMKNEDSE